MGDEIQNYEFGIINKGRHTGLPLQVVYERLEREIHGFLCDMGMAAQRTDEFIDQEELVKRFIVAWNAVVEKIKTDVMKQVEAGKMKVKI
jgi:hypothetical protein